AMDSGLIPFDPSVKCAVAEMKIGIWTDNRFYLPSLSKEARSALDTEITKAVAKASSAQSNFVVALHGAPQLLFFRQLNPGSLFPPAYEVCVYSLVDSMV